MRKADVTCPKCSAGFRRIELISRRGRRGEFRGPVCSRTLEIFDGSTVVAYRHADTWTMTGGLQTDAHA